MGHMWLWTLAGVLLIVVFVVVLVTLDRRA